MERRQAGAACARTAAPWCRGREAQVAEPGTASSSRISRRRCATTRDAQRGCGDEPRRGAVPELPRDLGVRRRHASAQRCEFCGSPAIVAARVAAGRDHAAERAAVQDQRRRRCATSIRKWYGTRWFAPNKLKNAALTDTLHGVYLPYWTFDAHVARRLDRRGRPLLLRRPRRYTQNGQGKRRRARCGTRAGSRPRASWSISSTTSWWPARTGVHADLLTQVEPFPTTTDLKPYTPEFVRGWTVERYQVDLRKASEAQHGRRWMDARCDETVRRAGARRHPAQPAGRRAYAAAPSSTCSCRSGWCRYTYGPKSSRCSPTATPARWPANGPTAG